MFREIDASRELQAEVELQNGSMNHCGSPLRRRRLRPIWWQNCGNRCRRRSARCCVGLGVALLIAAATAATIVWGMLAWQYFARMSDAPNYDPTLPLATIYKTRVADGFRPTWVCDDPHEFAATFLRAARTGIAAGGYARGNQDGRTYLLRRHITIYDDHAGPRGWIARDGVCRPS